VVLLPCHRHIRQRAQAGNGWQEQPVAHHAYQGLGSKGHNEDLIEKVFVGQDVAESMAFYLEASDEWLHAYDRRTAEQQAPANGNGQTEYAQSIPNVGPGDFPLDPVEPMMEDIPF
jgi:hypothetical protein